MERTKIEKKNGKRIKRKDGGIFNIIYPLFAGILLWIGKKVIGRKIGSCS
jgi:hypothetical protein